MGTKRRRPKLMSAMEMLVVVPVTAAQSVPFAEYSRVPAPAAGMAVIITAAKAAALRPSVASL